MELQDLDRVLAFFFEFRNSTGKLDQYKLDNHLNNAGTARTLNTTIIIQKLMRDGLLLHEYVELLKNSITKAMTSRQSTDAYYISYDGIQFHLGGGYTANQQAVEEKRKFEESKRRLELRQIKSTIITNKNVRKLNNIQKGLIVIATVFSAASLLLSYLTYKKDEVINLPAPQIIIQQLRDTLGIDTPSRNTSQNPQSYLK